MPGFKITSNTIKHYSSGMWARLAFSVAAHLEPEILLIDEMLSVGDNEFQKKSLAKMNDLWIHLLLEASEPHRIVKIIVELVESSGEKIFSMYDSDSGFSLTNIEGNTHVSLVLKDIRFYPGRYHISVSLISEILNFRYDCYDELENVISFEVENHLISGHSPLRKSGLLFLTPEWQIYQH
jgi:hypothetical protein